jgi:hypothetical protein
MKDIARVTCVQRLHCSHYRGGGAISDGNRDPRGDDRLPRWMLLAASPGSIDDFGLYTTPSLDSLTDAARIDTDTEEVQLRVPSCPALEIGNIMQWLTPHEYFLQQAQAILLLRRPVFFAALAGCLELSLVVSYFFEIDFFAGLTLLFGLFGASVAVIKAHQDFFLEVVFPPIMDFGSRNESNRIYPLEDLASFISTVGSRIHCFFLGCSQKSDDATFLGRLIWILFLVCLFVIFAVLPTFVVFVVAVQLVLFLPAVLFHPSVYPWIAPILQKLMKSVAPKMKVD